MFMKTAKKMFEDALRGLLWLVLSTALQSFGVGGIDQTFSELQIGPTTYRNATITTKTKDYIFILHSKGMTNIKVRDLPVDVLTKLGYEDPAAAHVKTNTPADWAKQTFSKIEVPHQAKQLEAQLTSWSHLSGAGEKLRLPPMSTINLLIGATALLALYLFHSYCCLMLCRKAGSEPGALVWVPLLQLFPLMKAASMSPWWFLGFLLPGFNLIASVLWCVKITLARGKSFWVALLLIFPLTSPFTLLYLVFSDGKAPRKKEGRVAIMTLEAA